MSGRIGSAVKGLLVLAVASVVFLFVLEAGSALVYSWVERRPFSRTEVQGRLLGERVQGTVLDHLPDDLAAKIEEMKDANVPDAPVIIHPYFGFVVNPTAQGVNRFGFFQEPPLVSVPGADPFTANPSRPVNTSPNRVKSMLWSNVKLCTWIAPGAIWRPFSDGYATVMRPEPGGPNGPKKVESVPLTS